MSLDCLGSLLLTSGAWPSLTMMLEERLQYIDTFESMMNFTYATVIQSFDEDCIKCHAGCLRMC